MKKVYIIHGWGGSPENSFFPWLKEELDKKGFEVNILAMPNTDFPNIDEWVSYLANEVKIYNENTIFVGHSIGCQTIMRYFEYQTTRAGGAVFVAPWFNLPFLATEEEKIIAKPWLETSINFEKVKQNLPKITAIFSDNDPDVDLSDKELFEKNLNAKTIIEHDKGHFSNDAGVTELPSALNSILEISNG